MTKSEKREALRRKRRLGHQGTGASHTREAAESEVRRHIQKYKGKK
tara:strand:+ start:1017 stop:1154 length:138 start_codon:yes stop_codon:yes gene_type:complete